MYSIVKSNKGFSMINMFIVLAVLTAIAVPAFSGIIRDANAKVDEANMKMLQSAGMMYVSTLSTPLAAGTEISSEADFLQYVAEGVMPIPKAGGTSFSVKTTAYGGVDVTKSGVVGNSDTTVIGNADAKVDQANMRMLQTAGAMYVSTAAVKPAALTTLTDAELGPWLADGMIPLKQDGTNFTVKVNASQTGVDVT